MFQFSFHFYAYLHSMAYLCDFRAQFIQLFSVGKCIAFLKPN
jgi:hypothetical protein